MFSPLLRQTTKSMLCFLPAMLALSSGCNRTAPPSITSQPIAPASRVSAPRLFCPPLDSTPVAAPISENGHRVILKWNASRRADSKHADAIGYCVYRGPKPGAAPTELVNRVPFPDTKCVDDSVENGKDYYYVVRAISARGVTSNVSKPPAPAKIPKTPPNTPLPADDSIPLCREPPSGK